MRRCLGWYCLADARRRSWVGRWRMLEKEWAARGRDLGVGLSS